ncbi:hypothetical protein [Candidatus Regiella insecticola]|uniref:hypothetical protein n=1 Tax=Candidatus Regiella insecticola TaxID=138073 RepID=UPI00067FC726|nr:hypothetical protein [Candidatus Regiella insecticola]
MKRKYGKQINSFIMAKSAKPLVKVMSLNVSEFGKMKRLGFMAGQITVPDDFDQMGSAEIEMLFGS